MASGPLPACAGGPTDKALTLRNVPLRTQFPAQTRERRRIGSFRVRLWNQHQARWVSCSKRRHRRMPWDAESYFGCSVCLFPSSSYCCLSSTIEPRSVAHHAGRLRALLLEAMRVDKSRDASALSWCGTNIGILKPRPVSASAPCCFPATHCRSRRTRASHQKQSDIASFKKPDLRNVLVTAPYLARQRLQKSYPYLLCNLDKAAIWTAMLFTKWTPCYSSTVAFGPCAVM